MMIVMSLFMVISSEPSLNTPPQAPLQVEKEIIYKKETYVDLTGSQVDGENQLPPAFFVTKKEVPQAKSLLQERLNFQLRHYNDFGF